MRDMPDNPNYKNPSQYRPVPDDGELDEATLDKVVGGLFSTSLMQPQNKSFIIVGNVLKTKTDSINGTIKNTL